MNLSFEICNLFSFSFEDTYKAIIAEHSMITFIQYKLQDFLLEAGENIRKFTFALALNSLITLSSLSLTRKANYKTSEKYFLSATSQ